MKKNYLLSLKSVLILYTFILAAFNLSAQVPKILSNPLTKGFSNSPKVSNDLLSLQKGTAPSSNQRREDNVLSSNKYIQIIDGYVVVDITSGKDVQSLTSHLKDLGMKEISVYGKVISGLLPVSSIGSLSALSDLQFARASYKPKTNAGVVTSQGDSAQKSSLARKLYNVNGKGITVGVLSDSYNSLLGADSTVLTGDLPGPGNPDGFTTPVTVLKDWPKSSDEGRAMIEIVHDVAPGANLAFNSANGGQAAFANGILNLATFGSDVIVDDVAYYFEPFFQDGIIAQAVDEVTKKGAVYFSAAGNQARQSYESPFKASTIEPFGPGNGIAHDFGGGDILQQITIPKGGAVLLIFQWEDPFFSVSGKGAKTDLDIYLLNANADSIVSGSAEKNIGDDPAEGFFFQNTGETAKFNILITKTGGPDPKVIKYIDFEGYATIDEYNTSSSTIVGHANAEGAIAVGATRYYRTPAYGFNPPKIEYFSSAGGTKILFNEAGDRIYPRDRKRPQITAPDGANTTFFIPGFNPENDAFPNFFGTSAAAPHAASVAALMLEATNKTSKKDVLWALEQSTIDMDDPNTTSSFDYGFDYGTGYGFIQADLAIGAILRGRNKHVQYLYLFPTCSENPTVERRWKIKNPNKFPVNVIAQPYNSQEVKYVEALPGETYFTTKTADNLNLVFINWKEEHNFEQLIANVSFGQKCYSLPGARIAEEDEAELNAEETSVITAFPNPVEDRLKNSIEKTWSCKM